MPDRVSARVEINHVELERQFLPIGRRAVHEVARDVEREAKRRAPVRTGKLRESIRSSGARVVGRMHVSAEVTAHADYAAYVEYGTRPHIIRAKRAAALHFFWHGREVFFRSVHHPGTRSNPFMAEAAAIVAARHH